MTISVRLVTLVVGMVAFVGLHAASAQGHQHSDHDTRSVTTDASSRLFDESVSVQQIAPGYFLLSADAANMVVYIGTHSSIVAGVQLPYMVERARALLKEREAPPVMYVIVVGGDLVWPIGDGGWRDVDRHTITLSHENLYADMRNVIRRLEGPPPRKAYPELPAISFSNVVQLWTADEEVHVVHERAGSTYVDALVHFEHEGIMFLPGGLFTNDGYPMMDAKRGGSMEGLLQTLDFIIKNFADYPEKVEPIVPGRGSPARLADLLFYRDMLRTVGERVLALKAQGESVEDIVSSRPTREFDERWGAGPVSPDEFVRAVYECLK